MKKLVLWQAITTMTVLAAFFITQSIGGNVSAAAVAAFITLAVASNFGYAFLFIVCSGVVVGATGPAEDAVVTAVVIVIFVALAVAGASIVAVDSIAHIKTNNINDEILCSRNDKVILLSCMVQFIIVLVPMLIGILR